MIPKENHPQSPGAGSGGGPEMTGEGNAIQVHNGEYILVANKIDLGAQAPLPPAIGGPCKITLFAAGLPPTDGMINVRGAQGVYITAGPPPLPPAESTSTNGVEIATGEAQNVTIKRGLIPAVDQMIEMAPGQITVDGGVGMITIQSMTEITIQVAGGVASIKLTPVGIVLQGPLIMIN